MSNFYVYQYIRTHPSEHGPAGSPYYIGKGRGQRAYKKDPIEIRAPKDRTKIILLFEGLEEKEAFDLEMKLILEYGRIDLGTGCLRNKTFGGEGNAGAIRTAEMRAWQSAIKKGKKHTPEARARMSAAKIGKKHSEQSKARQSAARMGFSLGPMPEEQKRKISASSKGKPKPNGFADKIAAANRNRKLSEESRAKIAASLTGKKATLEAKEKMSRSHKLRWEKIREANEQSNASIKLKF